MSEMTIQENWEGYRKDIVHPEAGPEQLQETKMAFYGGASSILDILLAISDDDEYTDDAALAILESLKEEARAFADKLERENR